MADTPAVVKNLIDSLVTSLTGIERKSDPVNFQICQKYVLNSIKNHTYLYPDHFDTYSTLNGFVEHFDVISKEPIARVLETRVQKARDSKYKFTAEVLAFLLHLSERPFDRKDLVDIEEFETERTNVVKELTWEDIIAETPLEGGDIWDNVDYGAESDLSYDSENERQKIRLARGRKREKIEGTEIPLPDEEEDWEVDEEAVLECFVVQPEKSGADYLRVAQYWNVRIEPKVLEVDVSLDIEKNKDIWIVSEQQSIREVLFMLMGAPTTLFGSDESGSIKVYLDLPHVVQRFAVRHASLETVATALRWFASQGNALQVLRGFSKSSSKRQTIQAFISGVSKKMADLTKMLSEIQSTFVQAQAKVASLADLQTELEPVLTSYTALSAIVTEVPVNPRSQVSSSKYLNLLFKAASDAQSIGDERTFNFMSDIFFSCFQCYLQPIREWMESGALRPDDTEFFIRRSQTDDEVALNTLWRDQFTLIKDSNGILQAPSFLHSAAEKIFTTGKSVIFLKRLIEYQVPPIPAPSRMELDKSQVMAGGESNLIPFDQLFASALDDWIHDKHHSVGSRLRDVLYKECHLQRSLEALEYVYFFKDGTRLNELTKTLFEKMDKGKEIWNDKFLLSELVQSVFAGLPCVDARNISAKTHTKLLRPSQTAKKTIKLLAGLQIDYSLPWPIMNLLTPSAFQTYRDIQILLLQLSRTSTTLTPLIKYPLPRNSLPLYHSLRHRLQTFTNTITAYLQHLVLEPQTEKLKLALDSVLDMDSMIAVHGRYAKRIKEVCLLGKKLKPIHSAILAILEVGVRFAGVWRAKSGIGRRGRVVRRKDRDDSDGEEEVDEGAESDGWETDTEALDGENEVRFLREQDAKLERLVEFIRSGLKGVARAGVMPHFEMLGEELW